MLILMDILSSSRLEFFVQNEKILKISTFATYFCFCKNEDSFDIFEFFAALSDDLCEIRTKWYQLSKYSNIMRQILSLSINMFNFDFLSKSADD